MAFPPTPSTSTPTTVWQMPSIRLVVILALLGMVYLMLSVSHSRTMDSLVSEKKSVEDLQVYNSQLGNKTVREILGRSTWTLLHTMAARYPEKPEEPQKEKTLAFIGLVSELYPCGQCARHFQELLAEFPPQLDTQEEFIQWLCKVHNNVNQRLDKPQFDCSTVRERWTCGCIEEV